MIRAPLATLLLLASAAPALASVRHLTEPSQYDACASAWLASHPDSIVYFPERIETVACGGETWGCALGGDTVVVNDEAPEWLKPWILMHEASHLCGWPDDHLGGREMIVTASMPPPGMPRMAAR